jgi:hypothetical protein
MAYSPLYSSVIFLNAGLDKTAGTGSFGKLQLVAHGKIIRFLNNQVFVYAYRISHDAFQYNQQETEQYYFSMTTARKIIIHSS